MSKFQITVTGAQLAAIGNASEILSAVKGGNAEYRKDAAHTVRMIDKLLKNNGFDRNL